MGWMVSAGIQADKLDHHPEWANVYSRVTVDLVTHDLGALSTLDVALAEKMEELASKLVK
jgi:4a-hydroxytetrahydrobiopterin dehydratase